MTANHDGQPGARLRAALVCPDTGLENGLLAAAAGSTALELVEQLGDYQQATQAAARLAQLDAVLIDVGSDRAAALELLRTLLDLDSSVAVVGLHRSNDPETILQCLRAGAAEFLSSPFPPSDLRQALQRIQRRRAVEAPRLASNRGQLHVFAPVKGGSGATTLAYNCAFQIQRETGKRVLLADLSLPAGVIAFLLRLRTPYTVIDALRHSSQLDDALWRSLVVSHQGLDILGAPERPEPALMETYPVEEVLEFAKSQYDYVIVDLETICDSLGMVAVNNADQAHLVCSTDMPSLYLMRRSAPLLEEMGRAPDTVNVLVNRVDRRAELSIDDMEKIFRAPVAATFPQDEAAVARAQREGTPVAENTDLGRSTRRFVADLLGKKPKPASGAIGALKQLWGGV